MRLLICNSKSWFRLNSVIEKQNIVKEISHQEELTPKFIETFLPDFVFFVHWNWLVEKKIYEKSECIVFHTAPLPYGRGGSPIQNLILEGFETSPVCAIKMTAEIDSGPIYLSEEVSLKDDLGSIFSRINAAINNLILEITTKRLTPSPQVGKPFVFKRLGVDSNAIPEGANLKDIYDRVRMLDHPDYPNAYIQFGAARLEFSNASFSEETLELTCRIKKLK